MQVDYLQEVRDDRIDGVLENVGVEGEELLWWDLGPGVGDEIYVGEEGGLEAGVVCWGAGRTARANVSKVLISLFGLVMYLR